MSLQMGRESHCFVPEIEKQENVYHGLKQKNPEVLRDYSNFLRCFLTVCDVYLISC